MLEILLLFGVIFLILTFFYKQAICDFRINQIEWSQRDESLLTLLHEKVPLVVRTLPSASFWTREDVLARPCFSTLPIFQDVRIPDWIQSADANAVCPWKWEHAEKIAAVSGLKVWAEKWMNPVVIPRLLRAWMFARYQCWAGRRGMQRTFATWTCILPVQGEIVVSLLPENMESFLPAQWVGTFPGEMSQKDTPFLKDLKFVDIIVRPGNALFLPAHWFVSWSAKDANTSEHASHAPSMVCTISYHTPISLLAFNASPFT